MVVTYSQFLEFVSIQTSNSLQQFEEVDEALVTKSHQDFLAYEVQAKALRYSLHEYMMRRLYKKIN